MNSCLAKLKPLLFVAIAGALILSARAQQSDQAIIFSSPQKSVSAAGTPSLAPQNPNLMDLPETLQAPPTFFQPSISPAPAPQSQALSPAQQRRMKTAAENRKDWAFATPEEIFGVAASQQSLNAPAGDDKNQTPFERYLDRQTQLRMGNTNALGNDSASPWNFPHDRQSVPMFDPNQSAAGNSVQGLNQFLNGAPRRNASGNAVSVSQNPNYGGSFLNPSQAPQPDKPDLAQQAAMERFRQLLNSDDGMNAASPDNQFFPAPKVAIDPNITQPDFTPNPAGASFTPVTDNINKPAGLAPLPGIVPVRSPEAVALPPWAPKPAPWLSEAPQPFAVPQRKF